MRSIVSASGSVLRSPASKSKEEASTREALAEVARKDRAKASEEANLAEAVGNSGPAEGERKFSYDSLQEHLLKHSLRRALRKLDLERGDALGTLTEAEVQMLISSCDRDGDGCVERFPSLGVIGGKDENGDRYERPFDLLITSPDGSYNPHEPEMNGCNGAFGGLNVRLGTDAHLKFEFRDSATDEVVTLPIFYWSFFDVDGVGPYAESIDITGFSSFSLYEDTEIKQLCNDLGLQLTDEQVDMALAKIDEDNSGECDFEEFFNWYIKM